MVASLGRLTFDEVVRGVGLSFYLNSFDVTETLSSENLTEIIVSYLITKMLEGTDDKDQHLTDRELMQERYPHWDTTLLYIMDTVASDIFDRQANANPFRDGGDRKYSFDDVVRMAELVSEEFGSWSNHECHEIKDMLVEMDPHETGRVKLADFYQYAGQDGAWQFLEPSEQLRMLGALDESSSWLGPQVMISNYVTSMSNCITSAPYYSICCLNECDMVFQQLEGRISAPSGTPSEIIEATESMYQSPNVTEVHRKRLEEIARLSGGRVPVHGRLFSQWLHFVFPLECPYPHVAGVVKPMSQSEWKELVGMAAESATDDVIAQHVESDFARRAPSTDAGSLSGKTSWGKT